MRLSAGDLSYQARGTAAINLCFFMSCAAAASVAVYRWRHAPARGGACATGVPRDSSSAARGTEAMRADTQRGWGRQIVGPIVPRWELSWLSCDVPMWLQAGTQTGLAPSIWSPAVASELSSGLVPPSQRCGLCQNFKQTTLTTRLYKVRTNLYPPTYENVPTRLVPWLRTLWLPRSACR